MRVEWGYTPHGATWVRTGRGDRVHIAAYTEDGAGVEMAALCGVYTEGLRSSADHTSGVLCPKCAKGMGIRSMADCEADPDEIAWSDAQKAMNQ